MTEWIGHLLCKTSTRCNSSHECFCFSMTVMGITENGLNIRPEKWDLSID